MIQTAPTLILVVGILVSLIKVFLEVKVNSGSTLHDAYVWLSALLIGIGGSVLNYLVNTHGISGPGVEQAAGSGLSAAVGAMVLYHLTTNSLLTQLIQQQSAQAQTLQTINNKLPDPAPAPTVPVTGQV